MLDWIDSGALEVDWALRVDALTAVMLVVVTSVSALVHLYSWGYMAEDDSQPRFFAYLSLFTFAMLMLVTADNLVQMFFGWEGVGLASYLLIGFWYHKPSANAAALKAFIVNRVGDFGFCLGIFATFLVFGTISIPEILAGRAEHGRLDDRLPRNAHRHDDADLHPPVHRRLRQIGPARPAHLAARRDGGPDPGLRPDPRRDDGHRRRVHGLPALADVRDVARRRSRSSPSSAPPPPSSRPRSAPCRTTSSG